LRAEDGSSRIAGNEARVRKVSTTGSQTIALLNARVTRHPSFTFEPASYVAENCRAPVRSVGVGYIYALKSAWLERGDLVEAGYADALDSPSLGQGDLDATVEGPAALGGVIGDRLAEAVAARHKPVSRHTVCR